MVNSEEATADLRLFHQSQSSTLHVDPQGQTTSYDGESFTTVRGLDLSETPDDVRITAGDLQIGIT